MKHWTHKYIGIPFQSKGSDFNGCMCWGLIQLIYKTELNIELPDFSNDYESETMAHQNTIAALVERERKKWIDVPAAEVEPFDVVILRVAGMPWHIGLMIDKNQFIHVMKNTETTIEQLDATIWNKRVCGFQRHIQNHTYCTR